MPFTFKCTSNGTAKFSTVAAVSSSSYFYLTLVPRNLPEIARLDYRYALSSRLALNLGVSGPLPVTAEGQQLYAKLEVQTA